MQVLVEGQIREFYLKNNLWTASIDFSSTVLFKDSWCFNVLISYKSCFLNMDLDFDNFSILDVTTNFDWSLKALTKIFGVHIESPIMRINSIDSGEGFYRVWPPTLNINKIVPYV